MKKASKSYKVAETINEHFTNKLFTTEDVFNFAKDKYKNIEFSLYTISQYIYHYTSWGFLELVKHDDKEWYKMVSQIPTGMSTYLIREFANSPKEIQREKLKPFLIEIRQKKLKQLKDKIDEN